MDVEQLPDLTGWLHVEVWTLEEAAMLWAGIDPMDYPCRRLADLGNSINPMQFKKAQIFLRAAKEAVCAGTLPFTDAWEEHQDDQGNEWSNKVEFPKLPEPVYVSPDMTRVKQAAFIKWAQSKKIPSVRQTLVQAKKAKSSSKVEVVDVVEINEPKLQQETVLLLEKPSPLDQTHPCHSEELKLGMEAWDIAVSIGAPSRGKTVKATILEILETYPQFGNLSGDARKRISVITNWEKKGGATPTPTSENLPTPVE